MSERIFAEAKGAVPHGESVPLDLRIRRGITVLLCADEARLSRYLKMMAGVSQAASGEIVLLDTYRAAEEEYGGRELRRRVGYVTPQAPLLSVLDGVRNVMLPALYHGSSTEAEVISRAQVLLDEMGYDGDHRTLPSYMPELQQRMLLMARALILAPEMLFIELPLKGLDGHSRDRLRDYLSNRVAHRVGALVMGGNDPMLASTAHQIVFIGIEQHYVYAGWPALLASAEPEVQEFIEQERRFCSVLQA